MRNRIDEGETLAKKSLSALPKGEFFAEERIEKYEGMEEDLRISVEVKITKDKFVADFTDNPPQVKVPINATYHGTYASVAIAFVAVTDLQVPLSQGYLEPIDIIVPRSSLFNAMPPAPVSRYWETMFFAVDLVWKALAPHIPTRLTAGHFSLRGK